MLGLFAARASGPVLYQDDLVLRRPDDADFAAWLEIKMRDRAELEPWQPAWADDHLTRENYRARLRRFRLEEAHRAGFAFHVFTAAEDRLIGWIQLCPIRWGAAETGTLGYWIARPEWGHGYATAAVSAVCTFAFDELGLSRVEAHILPRNIRSRRVLEKAGFREEGQLRGFLEIAGRREDHLSYARLSTDL